MTLSCSAVIGKYTAFSKAKALLAALLGRRCLGAPDHKTLAGDISAVHHKNQTRKFSTPQCPHA